MADDATDNFAEARDGTIELVSAYVSNANTRLGAEELQSLIRETFATLSSLQATAAPEAADGPLVQTASKAEIKKSIGAETIVSFEDGKPYKSLKRHLTTRGMTPADYRAKWGLPGDYPMVHPTYSAHRSALAKAAGLGAKGRQPKTDDVPAAKARKPRAAKAAT